MERDRIQRAGRFRIRPYRKLIQFGFLLITLWIGVEFALFVHQLQIGAGPSVTRPPGVESFLPISALISLNYWIRTGVINTIHPAALVILLIAVGTGLLLKRGFCSWVCPFGLLSEYLARLHQAVFRRLRYPPKWLDYPLRGLKYLLLAFFLWSVFFGMNLESIERFIYSPYNRIADIKMFTFFADISPTALWTIVALAVLSIVIPFAWCRYLCPYGALLGGTSILSPLKIRRNRSTCIDCTLCTKACPVNVEVHSASTVLSDECHGCLSCVDACPVKDTLSLSFTGRRGRIPRPAYAAVLVLLFLIGTGVARLTGHWQNTITHEEYLYHVERLDQPEYQHNRGEVPDYELRSEWSGGGGGKRERTDRQQPET